MAIRPPRAGFTVSRRMSERARANDPAASPADEVIAGFSGFGAMVGSLRRLIEQFSESVDAAHGAASAQAGGASAHQDAASAQPGNTIHGATRTVELGDKGRMVFGYTLRMGPDGIAAEPFGNIQPASPQPAQGTRAQETRAQEPRAQAPITDIFEDGEDIVVVAEIPGVDAASIACSVKDRTLLIETTGARRYRKSLHLPAAARPDTLRQSYCNGILEVRMRSAGA